MNSPWTRNALAINSKHNLRTACMWTRNKSQMELDIADTKVASAKKDTSRVYMPAISYSYI